VTIHSGLESGIFEVTDIWFIDAERGIELHSRDIFKVFSVFFPEAKS